MTIISVILKKIMKFYFCLLYDIMTSKIKVLTTLKILRKAADIKTKTTNSMSCLTRLPRDLFKSNVATQQKDID